MESNAEEKKTGNGNEEFLTTNQGVRVDHTDDSLKAGTSGPVAMEDFHFREKLMHFDHERIPERVVHARGSGAYGHFRVFDNSMVRYTKAKFLTDPSLSTDVFVRFSTVVGFRGSADTVRDVRGFATKFYTVDGNFDLVGNNMPVFFIQDAIKFPDLVHAIKPEPAHEMPQASAAHDNFWDFISMMPESMHMIMWVLSDRALPRSYAMMEGFGVHTFRLINDEGKATFVKFHWKPILGMHSLVWDEVQKIAGFDPDFNRRDLWERIEEGNPVEFDLGVQLVDEDQEHAFTFDLLDATKIIPEELVPVKIIGRMTLDRNPENFFAETEQAAFHPGHIVPGIDFTNDPLLQGRLFSYLDTQINRFGSANFSEVPVNRPRAVVANNQRDGFMRQTVNKGNINYFPNTLGGGNPHPASFSDGGFIHHRDRVEGVVSRSRTPGFKDFFTQAALFYNSLAPVEKKHLLAAFHFELGKVNSMEVRQNMVAMITNVDLDLAKQVAKGIGIGEPDGMIKVKGVDYEAIEQLSVEWKDRKKVTQSPALSMENTIKDNIRTRKVAILVEDGYNQTELLEMIDFLKQEGAKPVIISKIHGMRKSSDNNEIKTDKTYITTASVVYDALYIPGGSHIEKLIQHGNAIHFINETFRHCKAIGATSEGVNLLRSSQIKGINLDESGNITNSEGVVTISETSGLEKFKEEFKTAIAMHRHWVREEKENVPA
ncbi:MAG TPA: catalase [Bacteroidales bacterium]|nr:catalase [Bacteroidales bacterium]